MINLSLATQTVCVLRYKLHYYNAQDLDSKPAASTA